jgi:peptide/nickel transport system substrate-binding protein
VSVVGPGTLGLRYLLYDPASGEVLETGEAAPGGAGEFTVTLGSELTAGLFPGLYHLFLAAYSDEAALVSERRVDLDVTF